MRLKGAQTSAVAALSAVLLLAGAAFGLSKFSSRWILEINGKTSNVPVHVIKNGYFVSLADLAKLPGWKVTVDLGARSISLATPASSKQQPAGRLKTSSQEQSAALPGGNAGSVSGAQPEGSGIEVQADTAGPPSNVRMTVQAALSSLSDLRKALQDVAAVETLKQKRDNTAGIVQQAENLLWSLPRTRTLQADLQVVLEDLQAQVGFALALDQSKEGILPRTHPAVEDLLVKYPDLHPCQVTKGNVDGLDVNCTKKMMSDITDQDFNDVRRDLDQYR